MIPLAQIPVFVSFFLGIRRMANLPVESMKTGGLLWFPDLTIADPYFLLPILCSASMLLTIEVCMSFHQNIYLNGCIGIGIEEIISASKGHSWKFCEHCQPSSKFLRFSLNICEDELCRWLIHICR